MALRQRSSRNPVLQLLYLPGKLVKDVLRIRIEGIRCHLVRAGGASYSQVDAARGDGLQDPELLGNFQRRIVRYMTPALPTRIRGVVAAIADMSTSGAVPTILPEL